MKFTNVITVLSFAAVAIAAPHIDHIERRTGDAACTNAGGALTCCQQQIKNTPDNNIVQKVLTLLALIVPQVQVLPQATAAIGITCGGIGVVPAVTPCASNTVCCMTPQTASSFSPGLVNLLSGNQITVCPVVGI